MKFNQFDEEVALERQIRLILSSFENVIESYDYYNFRCPICGDSKKSRSKKRGYILKKRKPYMYFCHNCFYKKTVVQWMKEYYPHNYKDYFKELLNKNEKPLPKIKNPKKRKRNPEKENTKYFVPINKGMTPIFAKAIRLCIDRKIPEEVWSKWFVATDGMYKNRLIIPFFDNNNKIYYYQGRALYDYMEPKYLSRAGDYISIYNFYNVDRTKPVIILEGPLDSVFVENSVAVTGVKIEDKNLKVFKQKRFLIDLDCETDETKEQTLKLLTKGEYVFCWKWFIKKYNLPKRAKWDINDVLLYLNKERFSYDELEPFFTNSIFDKVFFI